MTIDQPLQRNGVVSLAAQERSEQPLVIIVDDDAPFARRCPN